MQSKGGKVILPYDTTPTCSGCAVYLHDEGKQGENMKIGTNMDTLITAIEKIKQEHSGNLQRVYIDVYECITFRIKGEHGRIWELVLDVNNNCDVFKRQQ